MADMERITNDTPNTVEQENAPTEMSGLTATMEIAGVESIPDVEPGRVVLGFSKE